MLAGDSAGGGYALALALRCATAAARSPTAWCCTSPWADLTTSTPDRRRSRRGTPGCSSARCAPTRGWWAGSPDDLGRPEVSPALADLDGLPPALMFCGTRDTLAPGCRLLAARAAESTWDLTYVEGPDLIHVYPLLPFVPEARRAWWQTLEFLAVTVRVLAFDDLDARTAYAVWRLRQDVFVVEQACPYPDLDGRDLEPGTRHLVLTGCRRGAAGLPAAARRRRRGPDRAGGLAGGARRAAGRPADAGRPGRRPPAGRSCWTPSRRLAGGTRRFRLRGLRARSSSRTSIRTCRCVGVADRFSRLRAVDPSGRRRRERFGSRARDQQLEVRPRLQLASAALKTSRSASGARAGSRSAPARRRTPSRPGRRRRRGAARAASSWWSRSSSIRACVDGATGPCAGSRAGRAAPHLGQRAEEVASGLLGGHGSKPIDGVIVGSTWSPAKSSPAARSANTKWPWCGRACAPRRGSGADRDRVVPPARRRVPPGDRSGGRRR